MPRRKCDHCESPATHHSVEVHKGKKVEKHLCDRCAEADEGGSGSETPVHELLSNIVKMHGGELSSGSGSAVRQRQSAVECEGCGLSVEAFRENSLLGCPDCYRAFADYLQPLLERAHDQQTQHIGKVPRRAGATERRQKRLMQMRKELNEALEAEDYERAAEIRDEIRGYEEAEE